MYNELLDYIWPDYSQLLTALFFTYVYRVSQKSGVKKMWIDFLINRKKYQDEILSINRSNGPQTVPKVSAKMDGFFSEILNFQDIPFFELYCDLWILFENLVSQEKTIHFDSNLQNILRIIQSVMDQTSSCNSFPLSFVYRVFRKIRAERNVNSSWTVSAIHIIF